jgi:prepilin-type N-terminal cleavage/methylation domain-containing protein
VHSQYRRLFLMPNSLRRGFTLIELLVVIAIIAILAAILFPVFAQAKEMAKQAVSLSNCKQSNVAVAMYTTDYDGGFPLSDSGSIKGPGWGYGPPDTVPGESMQPYMKNTLILIDPLDPWQSQAERIQDQCKYMTGCSYPNNVTAAMQAYALGVRSNYGYNFEFFSPWICNPSDCSGYVGSLSVSESEAAHEATSLMWASSIWNRTPTTGNNGGDPTGGGNWVVETPCFLSAPGVLLPPMNSIVAPLKLESYPSGWDDADFGTADVYGFVWPFYHQTAVTGIPNAGDLKDGFVITGFADSHAKALPLEALVTGCNVYGGSGEQKGIVTNASTFIWSLQ